MSNLRLDMTTVSQNTIIVMINNGRSYVKHYADDSAAIRAMVRSGGDGSLKDYFAFIDEVMATWTEIQTN